MVQQCKAAIEVTSGVVRLFTSGGEQGQPFQLAVAFSADEGEVTLKALATGDQHLTSEHQRAVFEALAENGFHSARWRRRDAMGGVKREIRVPLRKRQMKEAA